ncbi:unnamed protein product [Allacma fusca]|uniref:Uncharacterized protein n=1 Tax=Allacma fusca TaxID=39272 RepID=A0A8J2KFF0_9HEXA|nr:unnamed protein product [Allacma fusca]
MQEEQELELEAIARAHVLLHTTSAERCSSHEKLKRFVFIFHGETYPVKRSENNSGAVDSQDKSIQEGGMMGEDKFVDMFEDQELGNVDGFRVQCGGALVEK